MASDSKQIKLSRGLRNVAEQIGLQITDANQFKRLRKIDVMALNKTGMLTDIELRVVKVRLAYGTSFMDEKEILAMAAAIEVKSKHPIARAIVAEARRKRLVKPDVVDFREMPGQGVIGYLNGDSILVGGPVLLTSRNVPIYVDDLVRSDSANQQGHTVAYVVRNSELLGMIEFQEQLAESAAELVNFLHFSKIRVALVTGDATGVAESIAKKLNIAEVYAEVLPGKRADVIKKLKSDGSKVCVVGTLERDAEALEAADVAIAIASKGADQNQSAGLHLASGTISGIYETVRLSQKLRKQTLIRVAVIAAAIVAAGIAGAIYFFSSVPVA